MFHALFVSQISRKMNEPHCHWVLGEGRSGFESPQVNEYLRSPKREREREREREKLHYEHTLTLSSQLPEILRPFLYTLFMMPFILDMLNLFI
jgi:hypothetical protein